MTDVVANAWRGLAQFLVALALCLLLPAWSLRYWEAWMYVAVFGGCCVAITLYLQRHDLALLQRRLNAGPGAEHEPRQQVLGTPLGLGSLWGLFAFVALAFVIVWRLMDEEQVLARDLAGYVDYRDRVKYRLVPFVW